MSALIRIQFTHFVQTEERRATVLNLDECETCGGVCQAPNAMTAHEKRDRLLAAGLKELKTHPAEQYWSDTLECCCCEVCDPDLLDAEAEHAAEGRVS